MASKNIILKISAILLFTIFLFFFFSPNNSAEQTTEIFLRLGHADDVHSVALSPDGQTLASGSGDQTVKLWDVEGGEESAN